MKYLHSGYILFCEEADHGSDGRIDTKGLFDLFSVKSLPTKMDCTCVVCFGTPYERRQYKGLLIIQDPDGRDAFFKEFEANDPDDLNRGHHICKPDLILDKEGMWEAKVSLKNWKGENVWNVSRQFWVMIEGAQQPDP